MKTNQTKNKSLLFVVMLVMLFAGNVFSKGPNDYNFCIRNVHQVSPSVIELDVWVEWTGTNSQKFQSFQGGLNFNYDGLANGGTIKGEFVPGSADPALPAAQQSPNWNVNSESKQIRFLAAIATPATVAVATPAPPGFRLGTLRLTNTVSFTKNAPMNLAWSFKTGTSTTTQTKESFYLNGLSTGTGFFDAKDNGGARTMKISEGGGCRLSSNMSVEKLSGLSAYPNPTTGKMTVTFNSETKSKFNLKVTDQLSKVVFNDIIYSTAGENKKDIDLSKLAKGMYFLSMETEDVNVQTNVPIVIQ